MVFRYGDYVPSATAGKLLGAVGVLLGILVVSLPVPIIQNKVSIFKFFLDQANYDEDFFIFTQYKQDEIKWIFAWWNAVFGSPTTNEQALREAGYTIKDSKLYKIGFLSSESQTMTTTFQKDNQIKGWIIYVTTLFRRHTFCGNFWFKT